MRLRLSNALSNLVRSSAGAVSDSKRAKREARVLHLLETLRMHADLLRDAHEHEGRRHPLARMGCRPLCVRLPPTCGGDGEAEDALQQQLMPNSVVCGE